MAEVIRMPRLSDTMTEGIIAAWHKKVGDKIKPGDILADVETDKATMELESYNEGSLLYIGIDQGKAAPVDGILAIVGKEGEDYKGLLESSKSNDKPVDNKEEVESSPVAKPVEAAKPAQASTEKVTLPKGAKEIRMPLLSDTMTEGKIVAWHKKVGDKVKADDVLADVETDKATMEVVGYEEGTLLYTGVEAGNAAKINEIIAIVGLPGTDVTSYVNAEKSGIANAGNAETKPADQEEKIPQPVAAEVGGTSSNNSNSANGSDDKRIKASPLAKKMAHEKGLDLSRINGSGDGGRITRKDVDGFKPDMAPAQAQTQQQAAPALIVQGEEGFTDTPLSQMRKVIAKRLSESMFGAPHFYLSMEINMDNAIASRNSINEISPVKISFNDMVIKACATSLKLHPAVNSSWMGEFIRFNHHIHIGSAVAVAEGLIVPVIKFADQKSLSQIATEAKTLYGKAKDKKLQPNEFSGNTFTISNLGMMDIEEFTAIINPPDSCILAVGKIKEIVVKKEKEFTTSNVMKVTLSCDHRSVDGAVGAAFLQTLKKFIENPVMMLV